MTRVPAARALLAVALAVAAVQVVVHVYGNSDTVSLSESSALALAEGQESQAERRQIAEGVKLVHRAPESKAVALAEGEISDDERENIAKGVKLVHKAPENKAVALAEGKISDEERKSIASGGIGGIDNAAPASKAVALAEGRISKSEAESIAAGGIGGTDLSPPASPALALAEDKITDEERESIARGGFGSGARKQAEKQHKLQKLIQDSRQRQEKAAPKVFAEKVQNFAISPQPEEVGTVVDGRLLARGFQVLRKMEQRDRDNENLNPRLFTSKAIAPLVRSVLKADPAPPPAPPAEKTALAKMAAAAAAAKQRRAAMAAEHTVLDALQKQEAAAARREAAAARRAKEEVRRELGMSRVEGRGGLDAMADRRVPLAAAQGSETDRAASEGNVRAAARVTAARRAAAAAAAGHAAWAVYVDKESGRPYYFDAKSGRASWSYPNLQQLRAREYTAEEEAEKATLREERLDADRKESSLGGFPAFGSRKYVDPKTGVLVSHWPLDMARILPAPNLDSSARIQNQRMAKREEEGPNSWTAGSPGKLNALGVNVDGGSIANLPLITKEQEENHKLEDLGVLVDHPPFRGNKAVPYPGFDRTQWNYDKEEPYADFHNRYEVDDDDYRLKQAGVRVYTTLPQFDAWEPENPPKQKYADGMLDNMYELKEDKPYRDYIPDSLDATPLHLWLKNKIDEGKRAICDGGRAC